MTITVHFYVFLCILLHFAAFWTTSCATPWHNPLSSLSNPEIDQIGHSGQIWETFTLSCYFWSLLSILVHFCALNGQPHSHSVLNFHQVFKDMYPTHQKLLNPTSLIFLIQFVKEILIKHWLFPWVKVDKSHHHQVGGGVVTIWSRSWLIITNLGRYSLEHTALKILSECHDIQMSSHLSHP